MLAIHSRSVSAIAVTAAVLIVFVELSLAAVPYTLPVCPAPVFNQMRTYRIEYLTSPGRLAIGDLNRDGRADIVAGETVYGGATTMSVFLSTGAFGGFREEVNYTIGGNPWDLDIADINGDGLPDVVDTQFGSIDIYLGNGDGSLRLPPIVYRPSNGGRYVSTAISDLNRDSRADLIISDNEVYPSSIFVRHSNGDGTFANTQTITIQNFGTNGFVLGELNNDGFPDIFLIGSFGSRLFFGLPGGTFGPAVAGPASGGSDFELKDVNGDGWNDIVQGSGTLQYWPNTGNGSFGPPVIANLNTPPDLYVYSGRFADLDGDGIMDVAVATSAPDFRIYQGTLTEGFIPVSATNLLYGARAVYVSDFNNDGMPDFAAAGYDASSIYTFINRCGDANPRFAITGSFFNTEGFFVNGAQVYLNSPEYGALSTASQSMAFQFRDLPAGVNYSVTPAHQLFDFVPETRTVPNLQANQDLGFEAQIRRFKVYGTVYESGGSAPVEGAKLRLVGSFDMDQTVTTNSRGEYEFTNVTPGSQTFYQIQFLPTPVFEVPSVHGIQGLVGDYYRPYAVVRFRFNVNARVTTPDNRPRPNIILLHGQSTAWRSTDSQGRASFSLGAGLNHTIEAAVKSLRFTPEIVSIPNLLGDLNLELRAARRNVSDFDGDGTTDFAVWRPSNRSWYILNSTDGTFRALPFGLTTDVPVPGDFDGDQKADIAIFRPSDGTWHFLMTSNGAYSSSRFGTAGDIPITEDFDRDGKADMNIFRPSDGTWFSYLSYFRRTEIKQWGLAGDRPLFADFDGDFYADRTVFRPESGVWYVFRSSDLSMQTFQFGIESDIVLSGDFDGDAVSDAVAFRPSTGTWYIRQSGDGQVRIVNFGLAGDAPMRGDFDGDGIDDIAVFRPSTGVWYAIRSSDNAFMAVNYGLNGDIPVPTILAR